MFVLTFFYSDGSVELSSVPQLVGSLEEAFKGAKIRKTLNDTYEVSLDGAELLYKRVVEGAGPFARVEKLLEKAEPEELLVEFKQPGSERVEHHLDPLLALKRVEGFLSVFLQRGTLLAGLFTLVKPVKSGQKVQKTEKLTVLPPEPTYRKDFPVALKLQWRNVYDEEGEVVVRLRVSEKFRSKVKEVYREALVGRTDATLLIDSPHRWNEKHAEKLRLKGVEPRFLDPLTANELADEAVKELLEPMLLEFLKQHEGHYEADGLTLTVRNGRPVVFVNGLEVPPYIGYRRAYEFLAKVRR